jgi:hypothetical protein
MRFNRHSNLQGLHAFLSASKYHWINYSDEKLDQAFETHMMAQRGTELHDFASNAIRLGRRQPDTTETINMYINDAIGFRMRPEVLLFYSLNAFGTADAISFRDNILRIFDLKTGVNRASIKQLIIYAALFCLEYDKRPGEIEIILRIYQNDDYEEYIPDPKEVVDIMDKFVRFSERVDYLREEAFYA